MAGQLSNLQQTVSQPSPASSLAQVNVGQPSQSILATNPSIIPNQNTRALAQNLASRGKI